MKVALQLAQQIENLRLHRDIERRRGFVADDQFRLDCQGSRDRDALPLAAGEFVRIARKRIAAQPNLIDEPLERGAPRGGIELRAQREQAFLENVEHAHARVERRERVLEDDLDRAPGRAQCLALEGEEVLAIEQDLAFDQGLVAQQLNDGLAGRRLAAA